MYCPYCGRENAATNQSCVHCKHQLPTQENAENNAENDTMSTREQVHYYANPVQSDNPYQPPNINQQQYQNTQQPNNQQQYQNTQQPNNQQQYNHQYQDAQQQPHNPNQPPNYQPYNSNTNGVKIVIIIIAIVIGIGLLQFFAQGFFGLFLSNWFF